LLVGLFHVALEIFPAMPAAIRPWTRVDHVPVVTI